MAVKAESFKNWCSENISPQSWARIVLKSLEVVREEGLTLKKLEEPDPGLELSDRIVEALNNALEELYETRVEDNVLNVS